MDDPDLKRAWRILGVDSKCTPAELQRAYTRRLRQLEEKGSKSEIVRLQSAHAIVCALIDPSEMAQNVDQYTAQSERSSQIDPRRSASDLTETDLFSLWREIQSGTESIPWGTMIHREGDAGGDMNVLSYEFHWSNARIIGSYNRLAIGCLAVMIFACLSFLMRSIFLYRENTVQRGRPAVLRH